ncbi:hypothetical protein [Streptomyces alkaliphilus]|uniref:hypothetical protein n=1 Tax=Streptomyces alkaliphilus TaxID=1472722 RepID=UPI00117E3C20|nr:hypothetical protein [Streptomyces alkaliphilus]MQS05624.1 hypothetical protein [Streptomyces alkaliphilus]
MRTGAAATALLLAVGLMGAIGTAGPAQAAVADCATGFVSMPYNNSGSVKKSVSLGQTTVQLHVGPNSGKDHGWAKITGSPWKDDRVWMDWSQDGGKTWLRCGPWTVQSDGSPNTSAAKVVKYNDPQWLFRTCGNQIGEASKCTGWW